MTACVGCVGLSLLGSGPSSSSLRMEWHGLQLSYAAGPGPGHVEAQALWQHISLYVLEPKVHMPSTPFAGLAAHLSAAFGDHHHHAGAEAAAAHLGAFPLQRGPGPEGALGVRRNLSVGLGLAGDCIRLSLQSLGMVWMHQKE